MYALCAAQIAAQNCDYYITKYQSKDLEQLSNVVVQYAAGIRRLEAEAAATQREQMEPQERARQVCIKMAMAANRSTWVSCPSLALFIICGEYFVSTHHSVPLFLSRPLYYMEACKRILVKAAAPDYIAEPPEESLWNAFQVSAKPPTQTPGSGRCADEAPSDAGCCADDLPSSPEHLMGGPEEEEADAKSDGSDTSMEQPKIEVLRRSTGQFDDYLHRGEHLAHMPLYVYNARVLRILKSVAKAEHPKETFAFDSHCPLADLYCQVVRQRCCLPRFVGRKCPDVEEGEQHAEYKLMLFQPVRCPGKGRCNDPLLCKTFLFPFEPAPAFRGHKPAFGPAWRACQAQLKCLQAKAVCKMHRSKRLPVLRDTTLLKMWFEDVANFEKQMLQRLTLEQLLKQRLSYAMCWEARSRLAAFCGIEPGVHSDQMFPDEFFAWLAATCAANLDADMLARKQLLKQTPSADLPKVEEDSGFLPRDQVCSFVLAAKDVCTRRFPRRRMRLTTLATPSIKASKP